MSAGLAKEGVGADCKLPISAGLLAGDEFPEGLGPSRRQSNRTPIVELTFLFPLSSAIKAESAADLTLASRS
jgi:hypothetical protein